MKDLVKGFVKWLIIVLLTLNVILWSVIISRCQEHNKLHPDREEWEDAVRYKIVFVTAISPDLVYWKKETKREVKLSSFGYDKTLQTDGLHIDECYQSWYCQTHTFVYMLWKIDKKYCK